MRNAPPAARHSLEGVFALSKRRVRFCKLDMAKYISHLDLLRCFTRSIMRSGLPVEYSQGFNPHQKMTFALPLPVGVTSVCECVDISFEDGKTTDPEIMEKLNLNLPPDIRVISVGDLNHKAADIVCAEYEVILHSADEIDPKWAESFFAETEVIVMKKTKKKIDKPINLMEYVRAWEVKESGGDTLKLRLVLDAGGERNLKPDMLTAAFCERNPSVSADDTELHRKQIFCKSANGSETIEIFS